MVTQCEALITVRLILGMEETSLSTVYTQAHPGCCSIAVCDVIKCTGDQKSAQPSGSRRSRSTCVVQAETLALVIDMQAV